MNVKVDVQFILRFDHAARLAMGSGERWETGLRLVGTVAWNRFT